jgi:phospholipase C
MLVVTYDEHGGFFDHVPPLKISTTINGTRISATGVRVPTFIISPYVKPGSVFTGLLDHTSLLQLLDDRFVKGEGYSIEVNQRQTVLNRILNALTKTPRTGTIRIG